VRATPMKKILTQFLQRTLLLLCMLASFQSRGLAGNNVLILIADDLGVDSFPLTASAGASLPPMPNLTALKNSGVLFRNAYAHPTCSPTRASILTGRHPYRTGIGAQLTTADSPQLQASEFTLPDAFSAHPELGYSLAMFGKWHLNSGAGTNDTPRSIGGWPHFAGTIIGALPDYSSWTKVVNGVATATTAYATTDTANDLITWIGQRSSGTPWLAWAAFNSPHSPLHFPPNNLHSYDAAAATDRNHYEAMCEALDTEIGRVLASVNLATTTVIFLGDNGTPPNVIQSPYNAAKSKGTLYAGGTRVPMIIAGAGVVSPDRESTAMVNAADIYATVLELAGINMATTQPSGNPVDSKSLLPILQNTTDVSRTGFSQTFGTDLTTTVSGRAVTSSSGYTLIQFDDGSEELYETATDANQATNLLGSGITTAAASAYAELKLALANYTEGGVPSSQHGKIRADFPHSGRSDGAEFRNHVESRAGRSICAYIRRRASNRFLRGLGLYPRDRSRQPHHGTVVFERGENESVPKLSRKHCEHLSHPAHACDSCDKNLHGPRRNGPDGKWCLDVRLPRCIFLLKRECCGRDTGRCLYGRRDLESRRLPQ
jgi:arylsulfatase B